MTLTKKDCRSIGLFSNLSDASFEDLMETSFVQTWPQNVVAITPSQSPALLYVLVSGQILSYHSVGERPMALCIENAPHTIQLDQVLLRKPYAWSVKALVDCDVVAVPMAAVHKLSKSNADVGLAIAQEIAASHTAVLRELFDHKFRQAAQRIAHWILRQIEDGAERQNINLNFEKYILASLLGMTPENLTRSFAILAKKGVTISGSMIVVTDRNKLENYAKYTPDVE